MFRQPWLPTLCIGVTFGIAPSITIIIGLCCQTDFTVTIKKRCNSAAIKDGPDQNFECIISSILRGNLISFPF